MLRLYYHANCQATAIVSPWFITLARSDQQPYGEKQICRQLSKSTSQLASITIPHYNP